MTDQERIVWKVPDGVSAGIKSADGSPVFSQPANSVSVNTVANPVLEGVGKQLTAQRSAAQDAAYNTIPMIHTARQALDDGTLSGSAADFRLGLQKLGGLLGMPTDQAANTETFRAAIGGQVLSHIKSLGSNPSDADLNYINKVIGGQITLEEGSLRRILDIQEKYARRAVDNFNADAGKLMNADPRAYQSIAPLMNFQQPPQYTYTPSQQQSGGGWQDLGNGVRARRVR